MRRYLLILLLFGLSVITYIDRACISSAKESIAVDLSLSDSAMGVVFSAFALGYALAQIPTGILADRLGPRLALGIAVTAWSLLTALTVAAWSYGSLVLIRFLFGVAEAGAFPGLCARHLQLASGKRARTRKRDYVFGFPAGCCFCVSLTVMVDRSVGLEDFVRNARRGRFCLGSGVGVLVS